MNVRPGDWRHNGGPPLDDDAAPAVFVGEKYLPLFQPYRHKAYYGGRGSAKSHTFAAALSIISAKLPRRIVCARQFQNSIRDSVKELLELKMRKMKMVGKRGFWIGDREIVHEGTGSRYTFIGLDRNPSSAKSLEGADICWIEEARTINLRSMEILIPTIRNVGSELWWSWNPEQPDDPVDQYFRGKKPPPNSLIVRVGIEDNPFFYQTPLAVEAKFMLDGNASRYQHIWGGDYDTGYETKIFSNVTIGRVPIPDGIQPLYGLDFGFGSDPFFCVKVYIIEITRTVYIAAEEWGHGVPLRNLPAFITNVVQDKSDYIKADSAQPIQIEHLNANGFNVEGAKKGPGSVRAGITWLQGYKIVIDPNCEGMREEARLYSWQVDRLTRRRLNVPVDAHNHGWDATRYACEDHIMTANAEDPDDTGVLDVRF